MELLDHLEAEAREKAVILLDWIGAVKNDSKDVQQRICTSNLGPILDEMRELIPYIERFAVEAGQELAILEDMAQAIDDLEAEIARQQSAKFPQNSGGRTGKLMQGNIGEYPLYCLLPFQPKEASKIDHFRSYKAGLILITSLLKEFSGSSKRDYRSAIAAAANALRLCRDTSLLEALPDLTKSGIAQTHVELQALRNAEEYAANSTEAGYIRSLETLFRFFLTRTGGFRRTVGQKEIKSDPDASEKEPGKRIRIRRPIDASPDEISKAKKSGLAASELAGEFEYITEDLEADEDTLLPADPPQTLARQAMARQRRLEAIERGVQLLPNALNRLVPWEIAIFLRQLKECAQTGDPTYSSESVAALATSFWLSKKLGDVLRLTFYQNESHLPKQIPPNFLGYLIGSSEWVIAGQRPKAEPKHADLDRGAAVTISLTLRLPDITSASVFLSKLPSWTLAEKRDASAKAFELSGSSIEAGCKDILARAKALSHNRITMSRVANALFLTVMDQCGDKALACMTLARPHRLGDTQLHYTNTRSDQLRMFYTEACRTISGRAIDELKEIDKNPASPPRLNDALKLVDEAIGCPIRPTEQSIARIAKELGNAVDRQRLMPWTENFLIDYSNLYTAYVVFQLQQLTGLRAVVNLLPSLGHIDFDSKLILASDKDDYTAFNTRLVPLPNVLLNQLRFYLSHRRTVLSRLSLIIPAEVANQRIAKPKNGLFFLLENDGKRIKVLPTAPSAIYAIIRQQAPWFGLPENCQRARIRSRLLELHCPSQWIDALLGHWVRGEEPWHRFSTTSLKRVCNGVRKHIESIATADGWRALRGLG